MFFGSLFVVVGCAVTAVVVDGKPAPSTRPVIGSLTYPPALPNGQEVVTDDGPELLKPPPTLKEGVAVARTPPAIDFLFYPGQTYPGHPWSAWGDSLATGGKYYASIGDHLAPSGNAFVYAYDPGAKSLRRIADVKQTLGLPPEDYTPGKIHGRLDMGSDGWIYFSTHRGSTKVTTDQYHYKGDWILRCDPRTQKAEVVVQGPVPKHCIPNSVLDPERMIFYGGTAPGNTGDDAAGIQFFAYDVKNHKLLYAGPNGPARSMIFARSTGRIYFVPGNAEGTLMRFDPAKGGPPVPVEGSHIGVRAATQETSDGMVYTVSQAAKGGESDIYAFNTRTEETKNLGPLSVGVESYVASLDADPTGRYLYYVPGAHGAADRDGSPIVQFDLKTRAKKVLAFLHPFYQAKYGFTPKGSYSSAVDPAGDKLYVTWNISRGSRAWDCVGLTVIHIPESER